MERDPWFSSEHSQRPQLSRVSAARERAVERRSRPTDSGKPTLFGIRYLPQSLGLVRPARVRGIRVTTETEWSPGQLGTVRQGNLLTTKTELVKPAHAFSYRYDCEEPGCKGHTQKIVDWELGEAASRSSLSATSTRGPASSSCSAPSTRAPPAEAQLTQDVAA